MDSSILVAAVSALISSAVSYGIYQGKLDRMEKMLDIVGADLSDLEERVHDQFVSNKRFDEMIMTIRDDQKEIKDSINFLISILTKPGGNN